MRSSTVCCARMPNLEIAFFSGNFLPAGVNASEVEWEALAIRLQRENEPQSRRGGVFSQLTEKIFAFAKRFS